MLPAKFALPNRRQRALEAFSLAQKDRRSAYLNSRRNIDEEILEENKVQEKRIQIKKPRQVQVLGDQRRKNMKPVKPIGRPPFNPYITARHTGYSPFQKNVPCVRHQRSARNPDAVTFPLQEKLAFNFAMQVEGFSGFRKETNNARNNAKTNTTNSGINNARKNATNTRTTNPKIKATNNIPAEPVAKPERMILRPRRTNVKEEEKVELSRGLKGKPGTAAPIVRRPQRVLKPLNNKEPPRVIPTKPEKEKLLPQRASARTQTAKRQLQTKNTTSNSLKNSAEVKSVSRERTGVSSNMKENLPNPPSVSNSSVKRSLRLRTNRDKAEKVQDEVEEPSNGPTFQRRRLAAETERLLELAAHWSSLSVDASLPKDVADEIDAVVGQTRLLTSDKFKQFAKLIDNCCLQTKENITCEDLEGFWDMIHLQVEHLDKKFDNLEMLRLNNWVDKSETKKPVQTKSKKVESKNPVVSKIRAAILARRKEMTEQKEGATTLQNGFSPIIKTPARRKVMIEQKGADTTLQNGDFSPVIKTPARRKVMIEQKEADTTLQNGDFSPVIKTPGARLKARESRRSSFGLVALKTSFKCKAAMTPGSGTSGWDQVRHPEEHSQEAP